MEKVKLLFYILIKMKHFTKYLTENKMSEMRTKAIQTKLFHDYTHTHTHANAHELQKPSYRIFRKKITKTC